ncbi:hypothetical protein [Algibacter aquimarinus]|uniref:hypothetical protein n=1 Tax=Algibacter aquimarinus TaxID=1136748 RepID=UPI0031EC5111
MLKTKHLVLLIFLFCFQLVISQSIEINGYIKSKKNIENIHVINKTAKIFTVTNNKGEFKIYGSINDTLTFTSIQHKPKSIVLDKNIISSKTCEVNLEELINELDEVTVGKILTGDLYSDINNTDGDPPINFYDVGIPGYTGKIATQSERRLSEAGEFKPKMLLGLLTGGIPLNPILNGISGRTKELKQHVRMERKADLLRTIKVNLFEDFFSIHELDESLHADFFYFCEDDPDFYTRCNGTSDIEVFEFLKEKLKQYKQNLNTKDD